MNHKCEYDGCCSLFVNRFAYLARAPHFDYTLYRVCNAHKIDNRKTLPSFHFDANYHGCSRCCCFCFHHFLLLHCCFSTQKRTHTVSVSASRIIIIIIWSSVTRASFVGIHSQQPVSRRYEQTKFQICTIYASSLSSCILFVTLISIKPASKKGEKSHAHTHTHTQYGNGSEGGSSTKNFCADGILWRRTKDAHFNAFRVDFCHTQQQQPNLDKPE